VGNKNSKYTSFVSNLDRSFKKSFIVIFFVKFKKLGLITLSSFIKIIHLFFSKKLLTHVVNYSEESVCNLPTFGDSLD